MPDGIRAFVAERRDDVRVVERRAQAGLAPEALDELVVGHVAVQPLDRHRPPEALVLREEDRGHPARSEPADDPVAAVEEPFRGTHGHTQPYPGRSLAEPPRLTLRCAGSACPCRVRRRSTS